MADLRSNGQGSPDYYCQRHYPNFESINFKVQNQARLISKPNAVLEDKPQDCRDRQYY